MAKVVYKNGVTSVVLRVVLYDSASTTGGRKTGLTSASAGLNISTIADVEATATAYTAAGSTIDSITTLGTFAAPTAGHCRFKEVDATNHPGLYEVQIADARWAVSGARSVIVTVQATGAVAVDAEVQLSAVDLNDGVHGGMSALPNTACTGNASLLTSGSGADQLHVASGHVANVDTLTTYTGDTPQTGDCFARLGAPAGASIAADLAEIEAETDGIAAIPTNPYTGTPPTTAQIATALWQDLTSGADFGTAGSIGALLKTAVFPAAYPANFAALVVTAGGAVTVGTNNDKAGYALSATGLDLVLVDGKMLRAALQIIASTTAGKISGAGSGTEVFVGLDGATTRTTVTVDASGNRSSVVYS